MKWDHGRTLDAICWNARPSKTTTDGAAAVVVVKILKRYTGPKGRFLSRVQYAALEGPLFHGIIGGIACVGKIPRIEGRIGKRQRDERRRIIVFKNPKIAGTGSPSGSGDLKVPKSSPRLPRAFQVGTFVDISGSQFRALFHSFK